MLTPVRQFQKYDLRVKLPKSVFIAPSVIYFGLHFSARRIQPTDEKVKAIWDAPTPGNMTELHSFLVMLASISNFIPKLSTIAHPLYNSLTLPHCPLCPLARRATTKFFHFCLSLASCWILFQLSFKLFTSACTVQRHVFLGLPRLRLPSGSPG